MRKVIKLKESELVSLIKKVLKEEFQTINELDSCLKSQFNISSTIGLEFCVKITNGDTSDNTLDECGKSLAKKLNRPEKESMTLLEKLTDCLVGSISLTEDVDNDDRQKTITEQTDPIQTQRELDINNNFCSVDEKGLIQLDGNFKGKKWEEFLCSMDILPKEIQKFIASADTECAKGKVVNYFKGFEDIKKLTDEINRIKSTLPPPPGKEPRELRNEMLKGIKKFLENKTVQFYSDYQNTKKSFVGYIRKVEMNTPGKFELTINKYDPTTKKILDWGEGYVLNSRKPRVFEYHCCEYQNDDNCDDNLIPLEGTDTRGFTPQEMYLCNRTVENIMHDFCTQKKDIPKAPYFGQTQSTPSQLTEDTNPKKPRLYGPRSAEQFADLQKKFCESDGQTVGNAKMIDVARNVCLTPEEVDIIQKSCPDRPISKIPNFGFSPEQVFEIQKTLSWQEFKWDDRTNTYIIPNISKWTWENIITLWGVTKETAEKLSKTFPDAELSKIFISGDYEGSTSLPAKNDDNDGQTNTELEEKVGLKVFDGKTVKFYDRRGKISGYGRIVTIDTLKDENNNPLWNQLMMKVTNIDENGYDVPKGSKPSNQKLLNFNCDSNIITIYKDEYGREQSDRIVYTNSQLTTALNNGYCKNVKKFIPDYNRGLRFKR